MIRRIPDDLTFAGVARCDHDTTGPHGTCSRCGLDLACSRCGHAASKHSPGCSVRFDSDDSLATYKLCPCAYRVHWRDEDTTRG